MATRAKRPRVSGGRPARGPPLRSARRSPARAAAPPAPGPVPLCSFPSPTQSAPSARTRRHPRGLSGAGPRHSAPVSQVSRPRASGESESDPVAGFLTWCRRVGLELSPKVAVTRQGTVSGYGMVACESVLPGELLFAVPRAALLSPHTCSIRGLLERGGHAGGRSHRGGLQSRAGALISVFSPERGALQSQSGWVPLLLALLHELQAPASLWSPYFALWPELGHLEHPMFWPEEERRLLLQGTGVPEAVEKDLANIRSEFYSIVLPFMEAHPDLFCPSVRSLELYHQLVALVMAYSFQEPLEEEEDEKEPNSPLMVPAADILNHLANHNANLEYSADYLRMVATQPIPKGHEIFNTYGQMANWQLIHMYGFVEPYPGNTDDTADIQMVTVREAAIQGAKGEAERLQLYERWDFLCKLEMVGEEGAFVIGRKEVLTEEELAATLKVLCMPAEEFREFKDRDGWREDEWEEDRLTVTNIPKLKASWRRLLRDSVLLTLQTYATDLKTEQDILSNKEIYAKLSWREKQALQPSFPFGGFNK
ncbi:N-lysine methyltransferase SETD6 isoform X4 [Sciurus carolinensis]|uniref:N-lysine methyltransferase SETD6 isoform X4 n=1 Tax=Sciurus carolinensis TaxID=30640 RepID=UPI001FB4EE22|nr:N-lysine methyltransferase SETD6 isoform X4 [Sciurus carolinensis]